MTITLLSRTLAYDENLCVVVRFYWYHIPTVWCGPPSAHISLWCTELLIFMGPSQCVVSPLHPEDSPLFNGCVIHSQDDSWPCHTMWLQAWWQQGTLIPWGVLHMVCLWFCIAQSKNCWVDASGQLAQPSLFFLSPLSPPSSPPSFLPHLSLPFPHSSHILSLCLSFFLNKYLQGYPPSYIAKNDLCCQYE